MLIATAVVQLKVDNQLHTRFSIEYNALREMLDHDRKNRYLYTRALEILPMYSKIMQALLQRGVAKSVIEIDEIQLKLLMVARLNELLLSPQRTRPEKTQREMVEVRMGLVCLEILQVERSVFDCRFHIYQVDEMAEREAQYAINHIFYWLYSTILI